MGGMPGDHASPHTKYQTNFQSMTTTAAYQSTRITSTIRRTKRRTNKIIIKQTKKDKTVN